MSNHKQREPPDPVEDYREWTAHRYTPGYYVGGKLPPTIRSALQAPPTGYAFGVGMFLVGVVGLWLVWSAPHPTAYAWVTSGFVALICAGAVVIGIGWLRRVHRARRE
jgi:hypothetical protein